MEAMQVETLEPAVTTAPRGGKKKARVYQHSDPVSPLVDQMTSRMPSGIEEVSRKGSPLEKADVKREPKTVSAYELEIPKKDADGNKIDPCHWVRERGLVPVRRYVVECVGHPELGVIRTWARGASDALMLFCQVRKLRNAHMFDFSAVEDPPAKESKQSSSSGNTGNTGSMKKQ